MSSLLRPSARQLAAGAAVAALVFVWPLVAESLVHSLGVRALATALLLVSAASLFAVGRAVPSALALPRFDSLALVALVGAAAISGERVFLLLVPGWVQIALARVFWHSVRAGESVFERVAFAIQPHAPDLIRPYCRRATLLWAGLFLANGIAIAVLALAAPPAYWRAFTGWIIWVVMGVLAAVDFVVRKLYFRIYHDRPIDRLFARFFPAQNTAMGRRANDHRREKRISLGMPP